MGRANHTPEVLPAGSDVANLSLLGLQSRWSTSPAGLRWRPPPRGSSSGPNDWAVRCNLVTVEDQVMKSFTAGHISTAEAAAAAGHRPGNAGQRAAPVLSGRELSQPAGLSRCGPAGALFARYADHAAPRPDRQVGAGRLSPRAGQRSAQPVDERERGAVCRASGERGPPRGGQSSPATNVWLWGLGSTPHLTPFAELYGKQGAMITAVDLLRGLAALIGWRRIDVPGATGYLDTDYAAKGRYAVEALEDADLVCVHVEATDEASHEGNAAAKVKALEEIDRHIVGPLLRGVEAVRRRTAFWSRPTIPRRCGPRPTATATCRLRWPAATSQPDAATTYDDPTAERSSLVLSPKAGG